MDIQQPLEQVSKPVGPRAGPVLILWTTLARVPRSIVPQMQLVAE